MSKHYKVASPEGAERYNAEVGEVVELDIKDEELAVVCAGWLEPVDSPKEKK